MMSRGWKNSKETVSTGTRTGKEIICGGWENSLEIIGVEKCQSMLCDIEHLMEVSTVICCKLEQLTK